jgi:hypothetical protein
MEIITNILLLLLAFWFVPFALIMRYFDNKRIQKRWEKDYPELVKQIKELKKQKSL